MKHKNPFKGIACSNGSAYGPQYFRHIEGARDTRRTFHGRYRDALLDAIFKGSPVPSEDQRETNPHPVSFGS